MCVCVEGGGVRVCEGVCIHTFTHTHLINLGDAFEHAGGTLIALLYLEVSDIVVVRGDVSNTLATH